MKAPSGYLTRNYKIHKYIAKFYPEEHAEPCGFTMKISSRRHRFLVYIVKRSAKTDGMGPFNESISKGLNNLCFRV